MLDMTSPQHTESGCGTLRSLPGVRLRTSRNEAGKSKSAKKRIAETLSHLLSHPLSWSHHSGRHRSWRRDLVKQPNGVQRGPTTGPNRGMLRKSEILADGVKDLALNTLQK